MKNSLNLVLAIALLIVLGCSCPSKIKELTAKKDPAPRSTPSAVNPSDDDGTPEPATKKGKGSYDLTMAQYKQISIGTPREDVERLLGGAGEEISSSTGGGLRFSVNKWEGDSYKSIILTFKNDKVMTKSQVGLK